MVSVFDPATLRNAPMTVDVQAARSCAPRTGPSPAFRVEHALRRHHLHVVDHRHRRGRARGEPAGLLWCARRRSRRRRWPSRRGAGRHAGGGRGRARHARAHRRPARVVRLRLRLDGVDPRRRRPRRAPARPVDGNVSRCATRSRLRPGPPTPTRRATCAPEPFIESDAPEIRGRGRAGGAGGTGAARARRAAGAPRQRAPREEADRQPALARARCCARGSATATSTPRSTSPWRARSASPRAIAVGLVVPARRLLLPRLARGLSSRSPRPRALAARRSDANQFPADATHCGWRAAASTARPRSAAHRPRQDARARRRAAPGCGARPGRTPPPADPAPLVRCPPAADARQPRGCWSQRRLLPERR